MHQYYFFLLAQITILLMQIEKSLLYVGIFLMRQKNPNCKGWIKILTWKVLPQFAITVNMIGNIAGNKCNIYKRDCKVGTPPSSPPPFFNGGSWFFTKYQKKGGSDFYHKKGEVALKRGVFICYFHTTLTTTILFVYTISCMCCVWYQIRVPVKNHGDIKSEYQ